MLKAVLAEQGLEVGRTHNIVDLLALLRAQGLTLALSYEEAGFLTAIYRARYPFWKPFRSA